MKVMSAEVLPHYVYDNEQIILLHAAESLFRNVICEPADLKLK